MKKSELIGVLSEAAGVTKAAAERVLDALVESIHFEVQRNGRFAFTGLGVFKKVHQEAAQWNHPQKPGEKVSTPARNVVKFSAARAFSGTVNK